MQNHPKLLNFDVPNPNDGRFKDARQVGFTSFSFSSCGKGAEREGQRERNWTPESEEVSPGVVLDFNAQNQVVGVEMLNLSKRAPGLNLKELQFQTA